MAVADIVVTQSNAQALKNDSYPQGISVFAYTGTLLVGPYQNVLGVFTIASQLNITNPIDAPTAAELWSQISSNDYTLQRDSSGYHFIHNGHVVYDTGNNEITAPHEADALANLWITIHDGAERNY